MRREFPATTTTTLLVVLMSLAGCIACAAAASAGDPCTIRRTGAAGNCSSIPECASVTKNRLRLRSVTRCGWDSDGIELVCCPLPKAPRRPPAATTLLHPVADDSVSARKCREYAAAVHLHWHSFTVENRPIVHRERVCLIDQQGLIVGGNETRPHEYPHMAELGYGAELRFGCGGSLISERFVLTAAHCIDNGRLGRPLRVRIGVHSRQLANAEEQQFAVAEALSHPAYGSGRVHGKRTQYNDIGLVRLDGSARLTPYVRPACLPAALASVAATAAATADDGLVATGWGNMVQGNNESDTLQKVRLQRYSTERCRRAFASPRTDKLPRGVDERTQMCAGHATEARDTCNGDSGGPLQAVRDDGSCTYTVVAVTSFGRGCGMVDVPTLYTRVAAFVPWLEATVWPVEVAQREWHQRQRRAGGVLATRAGGAGGESLVADWIVSGSGVIDPK